MRLFRKQSNTIDSPATYSLVQGELDGYPLIGHYDFSLLKNKNKKSYPYMLGISVQGFLFDDNLLPVSDGRQAIDEYEDQLTALIGQTTKSIFAGHTFWKGALEIIFYIEDYGALVQILEKEARNEKPLNMNFKIDMDPNWSQLKSILNA